MSKESFNLAFLKKKIEAFETLDRIFQSASHHIENADDFMDLIRKVKKSKFDVKNYISQFSNLHLDAALSLKVKKIRDNYGYNIDQILGVLGTLSVSPADGFLSQENEDLDLEDAITYDRLEDFLELDRPRRKLEVGTLLCRRGLPPAVIQNLEKLKECYTYGLNEPTVVFCRAIIEASVHDALERKGMIEIKRDTIIVKSYAHLKSISKLSANTINTKANQAHLSLKDFMKMIEPLMYKPNYDAAWKVIRRANNVLHTKHKPIRLTEQDAFNSIKTAFAIVEELYQ